MTIQDEETIYDFIDDICDDLERLKGRMYMNDNMRADKNCPKIYKIQKELREIMDDYSGFIEEA